MPAKKKTVKLKARKAPRVTFGPNPYAYRYRRRRMGAGVPPYVVTRYVEQPKQEIQIPPTQMQQITETMKQYADVIGQTHKTVKGTRQIFSEGLQMTGQAVSTVGGAAWAADKVRHWWDPAGAARKDGETRGQKEVNEEYGKLKGKYDAIKDIGSDVLNIVKQDSKAAYNWMFPPKNETIQENPAKNQTETGSAPTPTPTPRNQTDTGGGAAPTPTPTPRNEADTGGGAAPTVSRLMNFWDKGPTPTPENPHIQKNPSPSFSPNFEVPNHPYNPEYLQSMNASAPPPPEITLENIQKMHFSTDKKQTPPVKKRTHWKRRPEDYRGAPTRFLEFFNVIPPPQSSLPKRIDGNSNNTILFR